MVDLTDASPNDKLAVLADARRRTQGQMLALAGVCAAARALAGDQPWIVVGVIATCAGCAAWWIAGYRRLKTELQLAHQYDELDESAAWGGKTIAILLGVFGVLFAFLFAMMWFTTKH